MTTFTDRANAAVVRYQAFTNILRSQAQVFLRAPGTDARHEAISVGRGAARAFLSAEMSELTTDSFEVAQDAHRRAQSEMQLSQTEIAPRIATFVEGAVSHAGETIAAQLSRDLMSMAQAVQSNEMRIDLYVRSGKHTPVSAAAAVALENQSDPNFRFLDRAGRQYKSTKHIRDIYRSHLMNVSNEVFIAVAAEYGHESVIVDHPSPEYAWRGERLDLFPDSGGEHFYFHVRDEIFHPSSDAFLTLND